MCLELRYLVKRVQPCVCFELRLLVKRVQLCVCLELELYCTQSFCRAHLIFYPQTNVVHILCETGKDHILLYICFR